MRSKKRWMAELRKLAVLAVLAAGAQAALACSCFAPTPDQALQTHGLIFAGTAIEADQRAGKAIFRVHKVYKGEVAGDQVAIGYFSGLGALCGMSVPVTGEPHLIFAMRSVGERGVGHTIGPCGGMVPYTPAPARHQAVLDAYALEVAAARRKVNDEPRSRQAREDLLKVYESVADHVLSLRELETLRSLAPGDAVIPARIGEAHLKLEQHAEALKAFDAALALNAGLEQAKRGRDQTLAKLGRGGEMDSARRSYAGMALPKADFTGRELAGADFSKAQLNAARFDRARLTGANFSQASIHSGSFADASLIGARFDGARTYQVSFAGADLNGARFDGADVRMGRFAGADLRGASLEGVKAGQANFSGARMQGVKFVKAYLTHADFSDVDLSGADLRGLELQGAVFRGATLVEADLGGAMLAGPSAPYRGNEGSQGPGRAADLRGADLTGAKLAGADLRFALFDCKTRWPAGFDPLALPLLPITSTECPGPPAKTALLAQPGTLREMPGRSPAREGLKVRGPQVRDVNLAGVDLSGANLSGFAFYSVDLSRARLRGADLRNADLQGSNLSGTDLGDADLRGATVWGVDFSAATFTGAQLTGASFNDRTKWPDGFDPIAAGARVFR